MKTDASENTAAASTRSPNARAVQVQPYLNFDGRCDEALDFYRQALGAALDQAQDRLLEAALGIRAGRS